MAFSFADHMHTSFIVAQREAYDELTRHIAEYASNYWMTVVKIVPFHITFIALPITLAVQSFFLPADTFVMYDAFTTPPHRN